MKRELQREQLRSIVHKTFMHPYKELLTKGVVFGLRDMLMPCQESQHTESNHMLAEIPTGVINHLELHISCITNICLLVIQDQ